MFVIPTIAAAIFFGLIASDQFEVESQFAIKGRELGPVDAIGALTGMPSLSQAQDGLVIIDYIKSRSLVEKLDREIGLRNFYTRDDIDWIYRFDAEDPIEDFVKYWRKRIYTHIENSGIVTVRIRAFTPEDALTVGRAVLAASEQLVNDMSNRSRRDALAQAQEEVSRAETRLVAVREEVRKLRDRERLLDPGKSGEALVKLVGELKLDRIKLDNEYRVSSRSLVPTAPQMQVLKARLDAVTDQIASIEAEMTNANSGREGSLSGASQASIRRSSTKSGRRSSTRQFRRPWRRRGSIPSASRST
jgi:capsular polysaccharide transport system permease protein